MVLTPRSGPPWLRGFGHSRAWKEGCHEADTVHARHRSPLRCGRRTAARRWRRSAVGSGCLRPPVSRWKKKYAGMGVAEVRRLKQLEEENGKLKKLVTDLSLDRSMLQDALH